VLTVVGRPRAGRWVIGTNSRSWLIAAGWPHLNTEWVREPPIFWWLRIAGCLLLRYRNGPSRARSCSRRASGPSGRTVPTSLTGGAVPAMAGLSTAARSPRWVAGAWSAAVHPRRDERQSGGWSATPCPAIILRSGRCARLGLLPHRGTWRGAQPVRLLLRAGGRGRGCSAGSQCDGDAG
jgi:hypothetical protein